MNAISKRINLNAKRESWQAFVDSINIHTNPSLAWKKFKKIEGKEYNTNMYLEDSNGEITMGQENIASSFLKEYSKRSNNSNLKTKYSLSNYEEYVSNNLHTFLFQKTEMDADFTLSELTIALSQLKQSAPVSDFIHNSMLKNTSKTFQNYIVTLFNDIWETGNVPEKWKTSIVVPIPKPGKDLSTLLHTAST